MTTTEIPGAWRYTEQERLRADEAEEHCAELEGALAMVLEVDVQSQATIRRYREALERVKAALSIPSIVDAERIVDAALADQPYDSVWDADAHR